jgi:hypothetical protein
MLVGKIRTTLARLILGVPVHLLINRPIRWTIEGNQLSLDPKPDGRSMIVTTEQDNATGVVSYADDAVPSITTDFDLTVRRR